MVQACSRSELKDHPFWRNEEQKKKTPKIKEMLKDILKYKRKWDKLNEKDEEKLKSIVLRFFVSIQIEEGIGMVTQEEDKPLDQDEVTKNTKEVLDKCEEVNNKKKYEHSISEEQLERIYDKQVSDGDQQVAKNKRELVNLYKGCKYIKEEINKLDEVEEQEACAQLLESSFIKEIHRLLMDDLLDGHTEGGSYSTCRRFGSFKGRKFPYPQFKDQQVCDAAIDTLICNYNAQVKQLKARKNKPDEEMLENIFRSAASFLFTFLQLHPFADGNGRLGRLLCSYFLELVCPFPCSIYNVYSPTEKSDYVKVLTNTRGEINFNQKLQNEEEARDFAGQLFDCDEADLTALIIESNWFTWQQFCNDVGIK